MELSTTQQELYDFIVKNNSVSLKAIQEQLGEKYLGALGKLLQADKIEKIRKKENKDTYATHIVTYYEIKEAKKIFDAASKQAGDSK